MSAVLGLQTISVPGPIPGITITLARHCYGILNYRNSESFEKVLALSVEEGSSVGAETLEV